MVEKLKRIHARDIDLIVYDFDGVMTDNRVITFQDGTEAVVVNRSDGLGVDLFRSLGIPQLIISTETNPVVEVRATKLRIEVMASCADKKAALENYCKKNGHNLRRVLYVGNDLNDLEVMKVVGFPVAPADAHHEILKISCLVTEAKGGEGVVREVFDIVTQGIPFNRNRRN